MELTLEEAARRLGLSPEAVRKRAARGTIASRRDGRRVVIILPDDTPPPDARPDDDQTRPDATIAAMQRTIDALIGQLAEERQRHDAALAEERRIIAGLLARLPEIAATATRPDDTAPAEQSVPVEPLSPIGDTPPRPWWRRLFGR